MIASTGRGLRKAVFTTPSQNSTFIQSDTRGGWTVGGGIEYALGYGWSAKSEYLYVDFGTFQTFTSGPFLAVTLQPREVRLYDHIFRAGLNYKFW